ncbi:MAG TPA: carbon-nitrogen family hydrolase [Archaeoglobaceae archaeon]|nr:carbon-nitrogen family hydrolase [Archaeoglobaceae archaeon]
MRVAAAQIEITRNKEKNIERALQYIKEAVKKGSKLVVLPEVFNTGFFPENYDSIKNIKAELERILDFSAGVDSVIIAGVAEKTNKKLYSTAVVIYGGKITGKYRKRRIFPLTDEIKYFSAGNESGIFETPFGRIGLMICYEIRFPEIARELTFSDAVILIIPAQFPSERIEHWRILLKARAIENQIFVTGANCSGYGNSMIVNPWGEVLAEAGNGEELIVAEIDLRNLEEIREKYPFLKLQSNL